MAVSNDAIAGLREQIIANAVVMFPRRVTAFQDQYKCHPGYIAPSNAFHVTVSSQADYDEAGHLTRLYVARLLWGAHDKLELAAISYPQDTAAAALDNLLLLTADGVGDRTNGVRRGRFRHVWYFIDGVGCLSASLFDS